MSIAQREIEDSHGELSSLVNGLLPKAMTISIVTINGYEGGQMILHDPTYNKKLVADRLRTCAKILESQ